MHLETQSAMRNSAYHDVVHNFQSSNSRRNRDSLDSTWLYVCWGGGGNVMWGTGKGRKTFTVMYLDDDLKCVQPDI